MARTYDVQPVAIHYTRWKFVRIFISLKSLICLLITIGITLIMSSNIESTNLWDTIVYGMLDSTEIQLYLFFPMALLYIHSICHDRSIFKYIIIRMRSKRYWISSKISLILVFGIVYTFVYICTIAMSSLFRDKWSMDWSSFMNETFTYTNYLSPASVLAMLSFRYLLGVWMIGIVYLMVYLFTSKKRNLLALLASTSVIMINYLLHISFMMKVIPFLSLGSGFVRYFSAADHLITYMFNYHVGLIVFIVVMLVLIQMNFRRITIQE